MWIVACPMIDLPGCSAAGFALKVASWHAFWSVVSREGSCYRQLQVDFGDVRLPEPGRFDLDGEARAVELCSPARQRDAVSFGANGKPPQPVTWNGEDTGSLRALRRR